MTDFRTAARTDDDVIEVLLDQHRRIRVRMSEVLQATGPARQQAFDEVRALLAVHETAEEMVLRPIAREIAGEEEADARDNEEKAAAQTLASLERMDVDDAGFDPLFAAFQQDVLTHAHNEETLELPAVADGRTAEERSALGRKLLEVERLAPTHPHPSTSGSTTANWVVGPFASMLDHVRDAVSHHGDGDAPRSTAELLDE